MFPWVWYKFNKHICTVVFLMMLAVPFIDFSLSVVIGLGTCAMYCFVIFFVAQVVLCTYKKEVVLVCTPSVAVNYRLLIDHPAL